MDDNLVIQIKELEVWTQEKKSWLRKAVKVKNVLLNNVSACIKQGEFVAVIGPSGAGKTTFLVCLAGKCTLPNRGTVLINGINVKDLQLVEILPQFEVFVNSLSVMEHLVFMTEMKLGCSKCSTNRLFLDSLLIDLKLKSLENTTISALSGGERRLLSLATSLLSNPKILITDEPTTGLDSFNAALVITALKKLSFNGKIVICSIHQPSFELFREFSSIMLMAEGRLLFHGTQDECKTVFGSINLHCPKNYNPAEFYIKVASDRKRRYVEKIMESYQDRYGSHQTSSSVGHIKFKSKYQRNWFKQVQLLLWRSSLTVKRNILNHLFQLLISIIVSAMVLGTVYLGISGTTQRGVQDIRGFLWLLTSELCFSVAYNALYVFVHEMSLYKREASIYRCSAFLVATFLSLLPRCVIWTITEVIIATLAVDLPNHILTSFKFTLALTGTGVAAISYGLAMAALFSSSGIMGDVMPCIDLPLFLMSGAFLRLSAMPSWSYPLKYVSHFYYGMDAISNIYWRQIDKIECSNFTSVCTKDGPAVLMENGYSTNFILQDGVGLLIITSIWLLLGYMGLKREERKGYVY